MFDGRAAMVLAVEDDGDHRYAETKHRRIGEF
jgi:hypothetical protein